jgi:hypothetical protein
MKRPPFRELLIRLAMLRGAIEVSEAPMKLDGTLETSSCPARSAWVWASDVSAQKLSLQLLIMNNIQGMLSEHLRKLLLECSYVF